jgi:hypothetical protein
MSGEALAILAECRRRGLELKADGDKFRYRPVEQMTPDLAERIKVNKVAVMAVLAIQPGDSGRPSVDEIERPEDLPEEWRWLYEERAAIREFDGRQAREHAEAEALTETITMMRNSGCLLENQ